MSTSSRQLRRHDELPQFEPPVSSDAARRRAVTAAGILTHLGVEVGVEHGFVFGTTIGRAIEMAREANLSLALVFRKALNHQNFRGAALQGWPPFDVELQTSPVGLHRQPAGDRG